MVKAFLPGTLAHRPTFARPLFTAADIFRSLYRQLIKPHITHPNTPHFPFPSASKNGKVSNADDVAYMGNFDNRDGASIFRSPAGSIYGESLGSPRRGSTDGSINASSPPLSPRGGDGDGQK